ncbi:MAG: hypothetical protein HYZ18_13530 [Pseudogulbenkiania sp.]|nr:hypothetical protein [Pseudogulbenkiania sp.]
MITKTVLGAVCVALTLAAAQTALAANGHAGDHAGGNAGNHAGGVSAEHMSDSAISNSNAQFLDTSTRGLVRAQQRTDLEHEHTNIKTESEPVTSPKR